MNAENFFSAKWKTMIVYLTLVLLLHFSKASSSDDETLFSGAEGIQLRKLMMERYNKTIPPGFAESPTNVGILLSIIRVLGLNEITGILTVEAYIFINWWDRRLSWEGDSTYKNISSISVNSDLLWIPNLNVFNCGRATRYDTTKVPAFLNLNGKIWWIVTAQLHPVCVPDDLRWYPADRHTCEISLGPLYPQDMYSFVFGMEDSSPVTSGVERLDKLENPHWDLIQLDHGVDFVSSGSDMFYQAEKFTLTVGRQRPTLLLAFLTLMLTCTVISWSSLTMTPTSKGLQRRLTLTTSALVFHTICLQELIRVVPGTGRRAPIIVNCYIACYLLNALTSLHTIILPFLVKKSSVNSGVFQKLPSPVQVLLGIDKHGKSSEIQGLVVEEDTYSDCLQQFQKEPTRDPNSWGEVVQVWDRVQIMLQLLVLALFTTVIMVI